MTLSLFQNEKDRRDLIGTCVVSVFCSLFLVTFSLVYNMFSHGVHSPFMTFLFAWPLLLCALPAGICLLVPEVPGMLRGIFDIAGNSSVYQSALMSAGFFFLACGGFLYLAGVFIGRKT